MTRSYDAIFFDMDGTLLPMQVSEFLERYYVLLGQKLVQSPWDAECFVRCLNVGMHAMCTHGPEETNAQAFWRVFAAEHERSGKPLSADDLAEIEAFMDDFYRTDFDLCGADTIPNPAARRAVETLAAKGYPLYLTTMPLFPPEGVAARLRWADVPAQLFARITTYDNSTTVKPQLAYYLENLDVAGVPAERVLMVGNNTIDDLACLETGMDAYLVTDELINDNDFDIDTVKHGSLAEFADWAEALPPCTSTRALQGDPNRSPLQGGTLTIEGREATPQPLWDAEERLRITTES